MTALRLDPPIPLDTPKGRGLAHLFHDLGPECNDEWTVFLENGEIWRFQNPDVRAQINHTAGRHLTNIPEHWHKP